MPLVLNGATSGAITLQATDATTQTITLPANTGTVITTGSTGKVIPTAALPAGTVLQVVSGTTAVQVNSSSSTYADTGLTATITPTSATSKIYVVITHPENYKSPGNSGNRIRMNLVRNGSQIIQICEDQGYTGATTTGLFPIAFSYLDSPASTSALTYKTQFSNPANAANVAVQNNSMTSAITLMEIAV